MNAVSSAYIRAVKRQLPCSAKTKRRLINQLNKTMSDFLEENPDATLEALHTGFGTPAQLATTMMQDLPQSEYSEFRKKKKLNQTLAGILILLLVGFTIYVFFIKQNPIESYVEIIPSTPTSSATEYLEEETK